MQLAKTLLCTTALLLVPALRAQQTDTPKPAADQAKPEAKDKQGPAEEMEAHRVAARHMAADVKYNRRANVIMKRLSEIYGQKNDAGKLEEVRGLQTSQNERYEKNMKSYREKLGAETYAAVEASMEVKATPEERKAARERLRTLLGADTKGHEGGGHRAAVKGKPVAPKHDDDGDKNDDDLDAPDESAGAAKLITPENADATLEKLKKELARGRDDKAKDEKPQGEKAKDAPKPKN